MMGSARILLLFILSEGGVNAETLEIPLLSSFSSPVSVSNKIYPFLHEKLIPMFNFNTIITFAMVAQKAVRIAKINAPCSLHKVWAWSWAVFWFHSLATLMKCPENNEWKQKWVSLTLKLKILVTFDKKKHALQAQRLMSDNDRQKYRCFLTQAR